MGYVSIKGSEVVGYEVNPYDGDIVPVFGDTEKKVRAVKTHKKAVTSYFKKAILSGDIIEVVKYTKPVVEGFEVFGNKGKRVAADNKNSDSINKAKMNLRRIINTNAKCGDSRFITLTYRENMQDIKQGKNDLKKFFMKWNYERKKSGQANVKYVYVVEFQERGAVHFHIVTFGDSGKYDIKQLEQMWGFGFIKVNRIKHVDNIGAYVIKYMGKALSDDRYKNSDLYGRSKGNLEKPLEIKDPQEVAILEGVYKEKCVYSKSYNSDYRGLVTYSQFNLNRNSKKDNDKG